MIVALALLYWNIVRFDGERCSKPPGGTTARLAMVFACALAAAAGQPAAAATITIEAKRNGDAIDIRGSVVLDADVATAWRVLTDYNRYPEFISDLRLSRVVARHAATVTVEQSGDAALWLFKVPLDITFEIKEISPNSLQSRAVAGSLRALTSSYTLTRTGPAMRLDYVGHVVAGFGLFGHIEQSAVEHNVARQFQALADEIERQSAAARPHSTASAK